MIYKDDPRYLLRVSNLKLHFPIIGGTFGRLKGYVKAVDGISFSIREGETLGLVGESGCGKSTTARAILKILEPTSGEVFLEGENLLEFDNELLREKRKDMQLVFQDPYASLNPRMTVGSIISEPYAIHSMYSKEDRIQRVQEIINIVGLRPEHINRFPHQFSGGQRQRIGIARALALNPKLVIYDEPVSALDVSIQAQILNLIKDLQNNMRLTYLFISHDLGVVRHISDKIAIMYLGKIVEIGTNNEIFGDPQHPYTQALLESIPTPDPEKYKARVVLKGDIPSPLNPPKGCSFNTRCPEVQQVCREQEPIIKTVTSNHFCSCHFR